jgi:bifunctional DNA-binding transcriptional regulator/antitoxin component of YhaV-PrlF toxin-antitoxin module
MSAKRKSLPDGATVRRLGRTGAYSYFITLPKEDVGGLDWRKGQKLIVRRAGKKIIIEDG